MAKKAGHIGNFHSLAYEFDNFDEFNASIKGWSTEFRQVERGIAAVRLRHRMTPLINVLDVDFSHSTASAGATQEGHRTFGFVDRDNGSTWCGHDVSTNLILRFDAHSEFFTFTPHEFIGRTLSIDESLLSSLAEKLGFTDFVEELDKSKDVMKFNPADIRRFRDLYDKPVHSEYGLIEVAESLITLIGSGRTVYRDTWQRNSSKLLDKALDYITENASEAITVADVCKAMGVGYRRLDRAFKEHLGHGPKNSIIACRLNGVRTELRQADPSTSVSDIVNGWGFWHLGDFARVYRSEFGELPSETLRILGSE